MDKSWSLDATPVHLLGQTVYHVHFSTPTGGQVSPWQGSALGCEALKYTVNDDQVVGTVTKLTIGEQDAKYFDGHSEYPLAPVAE
jgi:hypothetical protein